MEIRDTRAKGWFYLDNELLEVYGPKIGIYGIGVYTALAKYANRETQQAFPSYSTISRDLAISRNSVIRAIKTLEENGLITIEQRVSHEGGKPTTTNIYTLCALKSLDPSTSQGIGCTLTETTYTLPSTSLVPDRVQPSAYQGIPYTLPSTLTKLIEPDSINQSDLTSGDKNPVNAAPLSSQALETKLPTLTAIEPNSNSPVDFDLHKNNKAVIIYHETFGRMPDEYGRALIAETVGDEYEQWRGVIRDWRANGYKPTNVAGMVDRFKRKISDDKARYPHRYNSNSEQWTPPEKNSYQLMLEEEEGNPELKARREAIYQAMQRPHVPREAHPGVVESMTAYRHRIHREAAAGDFREPLNAPNTLRASLLASAAATAASS